MSQISSLEGGTIKFENRVTLRRACPLFERAFASGDVSHPPHKEELLLLASGNPTLVPPSSFFPLRSPIPRSFTSIHIAISLFELECANSTPSDRLPLHGGAARRPLHFQFPAFFCCQPSGYGTQPVQQTLYNCLPINPALLLQPIFPILVPSSTHALESNVGEIYRCRSCGK